MLDGAARVKPTSSTRPRRAGHAGDRDHRPRQHLRRYDFWKQANAAGIKPIIGTEAYLTPGTRRSDRTRVRWGNGGEDDVSGSGAYTHMTLLAETTDGHAQPVPAVVARVDRGLLLQAADGPRTAAAATPRAHRDDRLRRRRGPDPAPARPVRRGRKAAADFRDIFGADNFFGEIMDHGIGIERRVIADLLRLARELDLPLVATNDLHYTHAHDAAAHAILLCVQSAPLSTIRTASSSTPTSSTSSRPAQMRQLFRDHPDAATTPC